MAILESLLLEIRWVGRVPLVLQVILMAKMLLHVLDPESQVNVSALSKQSGVSRQTLYSWAYKAISILGISCITSSSQLTPHNQAPTADQIESLQEQIHQLQLRNQELDHDNQKLQDQIEYLNRNLAQIVDKSILVLRLSGKVSYRGISECIRLIFAVHLPPHVIESTLSRAANQAEIVNQSLLESIRQKESELMRSILKRLENEFMAY